MKNHNNILFGDCLLLAGGKSTRMGFDKQTLLMNENEFLSEKIIMSLKQRFSMVFVATQRPELYDAFNVTVIGDILPNAGPISGIHSALSLCRSQYLYVCACDMQPPDLNYIDYLMKMAIEKESAQAIVTEKDNHIQPFHAFYRRDLQPLLTEFILHKGRSILHFLNTISCEYISQTEVLTQSDAIDENMFWNLNYIQNEENEDSQKVITVPAIKVTKEKQLNFTDFIANESICTLVAETPNHESIYQATFHYSKGEEKELFYGNLLSQGVIHTFNQVEQLEMTEILVKATINHINVIHHMTCFSANPVKFSKEIIFESSAKFLTKSKLFEKTGALHSCALCDHHGILRFFEDIGRHNAIDKIIGYALLNHISFHDKFILSSGRMPLEIVKKVTNAGFPLLVSRSAPTDQAIAYAKKNDLCLVGFSRNSRFNIYSHAERISQSF